MRAPYLARIYHRGRAHLPATLEDYAFVQGPVEVFLVRPEGAKDTDFLEVWRAHHVPRARMLRVAQEDLEVLASQVPALQGRAPVEGRVTAFVCREGACELPVTTPEAFAAQLLAL